MRTRLQVAALHAKRVVAERGGRPARGNEASTAPKASTFTWRRKITLSLGSAATSSASGAVEARERVGLAPAQHRLDVHGVARTVDGLVGVDVARPARGPAPAATTRRDRWRPSVRRTAPRRPRLSGVSSGSAASNRPSADVRPPATGFCRTMTRTSQSAAGSPVKRSAAKNSDLARRRLGDQADVRDDHDRVGAEQAAHRLDDVDAGLLQVDRYAAHLGVAVVGQQLAPRRHELAGVEQRHLREGGLR